MSDTTAKENCQPKCTVRFLLLETSFCKFVEGKQLTNPLQIVNILFTFQKPEKLIQWLDSNTEDNYTKIINFVTAVQDEYNKLAADYNTLKVNWVNNPEEILKQKETFVEQHRVVQFLQDQNTDFTQENDTLYQKLK